MGVSRFLSPSPPPPLTQLFFFLKVPLPPVLLVPPLFLSQAWSNGLLLLKRLQSECRCGVVLFILYCGITITTCPLLLLRNIQRNFRTHLASKEEARLREDSKREDAKRAQENKLRDPRYWKTRFANLEKDGASGFAYLKRAELVAALKANSLLHSGRKAQLVERLRTWIEGDIRQKQLLELERLRKQKIQNQATSDKTYSFGLNDRGQLGQGDLRNRQDPQEIVSLTGIN